MAFTLAHGIAYVQAALDAGLEIDRFGPRLAFFFNGHNNVFQEVAKFRAGRRMWAEIMREIENETICRYKLPIVTVFNNGGIYRVDYVNDYSSDPKLPCSRGCHDRGIERGRVPRSLSITPIFG